MKTNEILNILFIKVCVNKFSFTFVSAVDMDFSALSFLLSLSLILQLVLVL